MDYKEIGRGKNAFELPQEPSMPYPVESLGRVEQFLLKSGGNGIYNSVALLVVGAETGLVVRDFIVGIDNRIEATEKFFLDFT